jgi:type IV pilus assembly protein PilE
MKKTSQTGFSLLELMVVVAIIAILSYLAMSNYSSTTSRTRRTEAKETLLMTSASLEECKATYGSYNNKNCGIQNGDVITTDSGLYSIAIKVPDATSFNLEATPVTGKSQANDSDCLSITLDNLGVQGGTTAKCW